MKSLKYISTVFVAALTLLSSCSTDQKGTTIDTGANNFVGFGAPRNTVNSEGKPVVNAKLKITIDENGSAEVSVPIVRTNASAAATVHYSFEYLDGSNDFFTLVSEDKLTFAAGESQIFVKVSYNKDLFPFFEPQSFRLTLLADSGIPIAPEAYTQVSPDIQVEVIRPVPFVKCEKKALYVSEFWADEWLVEVEESDPSILPGAFYRIKSPFGLDICPDVEGMTVNGQFDLIIDTRNTQKVSLFDDSYGIGLDLGDGPIFVTTAANTLGGPKYSYGTFANNVITLNDTFFFIGKLEDGMGYGMFKEVIKLDQE